MAASNSKPPDATARALLIPEAPRPEFGSKFKGKQKYISLFKENRAPSEESRLHFVDPSSMGEVEITIEEIDRLKNHLVFVCLDMLWDRG